MVVEESAQHRKAVGPPDRFDLIAGLQFSLLFALGLRDRHRLLDIGCGSLRGGRLFIPYLAAGNYYGIEPDESLVDAGIRYEVGHDACEMKSPHFLYDGEFAFGKFETQFDFLMAQSILSHTHSDLMRPLLANARSVIADDGIFAGTFFWSRPALGTHMHRIKGPGGAGWVGEGGVAYRWNELSELFSEADFAVKRLRFPHPVQTWFVAVRKSRADRLTGLARRAQGWGPMATELWRSEPLGARNRRVYVARRRLEMLGNRLHR